jgi:hypothetical protein
MKLSNKITLALGLLLAGATHAQTTATTSTPTTGPGLMGQRYAEFGSGVHDFKLAGDATLLGVGANLPVVPSLLDAGVTYSYDWTHGSPRTHHHTFGASATIYAPLNGVKPFVGIGAGWQTHRHNSDDQGIWNASAGVEIPAGDFTLTPRVTYASDFEAPGVRMEQWNWAVEANYWANAKAGVFAAVGRSDLLHRSERSWNYQIGVRVRL